MECHSKMKWHSKMEVPDGCKGELLFFEIAPQRRCPDAQNAGCLKFVAFGMLHDKIDVAMFQFFEGRPLGCQRQKRVPGVLCDGRRQMGGIVS